MYARKRSILIKKKISFNDVQKCVNFNSTNIFTIMFKFCYDGFMFFKCDTAFVTVCLFVAGKMFRFNLKRIT